MSIIGKIFGYAPKAYDYTKRLVNAAPYIIFEDAAHKGVASAAAVTRSANESWGSVFKNMIKEGGRGIEESVKESKKANGGFLKSAWKSIKEIPSVVKSSARAGSFGAMRNAVKAGKTGFEAKLAGVMGGAKGFFKGIGKKMPIIGNLMLVAFELPNIFKATKEQGIGQGVAEVAKAGVRLTAASLLSAAGTAIGGPIGGIAGFIIGDWLASKVVGKSYTEKKAEEEQKLAELMGLQQQQQAVAQNNPKTQAPSFTGNNPFATGMTNPVGYGNDYMNPYADDIMMKGLNFNTVA